MLLRRLLVDRNVASSSQVDEASARRLVYGGDFLTNLFEVATPDEHRLIDALSAATGLPAGPPGSLLPTEEAFHVLAAEFATNLQAVPLGTELSPQGRLTWLVAVGAPPTVAMQNELRRHLGEAIQFVIVPYLRLAEALSDLYGAPMPRRIARALLRLGGMGSLPPASTPFSDWARTQREAQQSQSDAATQNNLQSRPPSSLPPDALRVLQAPVVRPPRARKRGPLTLSFLRAELDQAKNREEVLDIFFEFSAPFFDFSVLWILTGEMAEGYTAHGTVPQVATLAGAAMPVRGVVKSARDRRVGGMVMPAWSGDDVEFANLTGRQHARGGMVVPVVVAGRTVAVLYGDDAEAALDPVYLADIHAAAAYAGAALERLILARRAHAGAPSWAPSRPSARDSVAPPPLSSLARPQAPPLPPPSSIARPAAPSSIARPAAPAPLSVAKLGTPPPPLSVAQPAAPPPNVMRKEAQAWVPTMSTPPMSRPSFVDNDLPSIILSVADDFTPLVERAACGDNEAAAALLQAGAAALPALIAAFPGPCIEVRGDEALPQVQSAGLVLRLLVSLGTPAASSIVPFLQDSDERFRFWATMMFTEIQSSYALRALSACAADSSSRVRRAAVAALKHAAILHPKGVVDALTQSRQDAYDREETRRALVFALGESGVALAVPSLVDALSDSSDDVAETAHHALRRLTFQDFGRDARRWVGWARSSVGRHSIEWMMEGILSESGEVRRHAAAEFTRTTGVQLSLPAGDDRMQIETLYDRLYAWWSSSGKVQFAQVSQ